MDILNQTQLVPITSKEAIGEDILRVYQNAFIEAPYEENFSQDEVYMNLGELLDEGGNLFVRKFGNEAVALAGGFPRQDGSYWIEELAVAPDSQGEGLGRQMLKDLLLSVAGDEISAFQLRTTKNNSKAISLYRSEGFQIDDTSIVVPSRRTNGRITLDERIYLSKFLNQDAMPEKNNLKRVVVAFPSGNTTAVVFDQRLTGDRKVLNRNLMDSWKNDYPGSPEIEQCCFVTVPESEEAIAKVEMFGGEFCGNATRSVIWVLTKGQDYQGKIEVSGVNRLLDFSVKDGQVTVEMPLPIDQAVREVEEGILVQLDGIAQMVVVDSDISSASELLSELKNSNRYNLQEQPAVGVSYYDQSTEKAEFNVWVKEVDTVFDETACGSGTCAIGVALATNRKENVYLEVIQPSGEKITVTCIWDEAKGKVVRAEITGEVNILYDGPFSLK